MPLSGDEAGFSLLQASGQAVTYEDRIPQCIVPIQGIKNFTNYSKGFSVKYVIDSLRTNEGMQPPFYLICLHYVLKYLGSNTFMLRLISIILSLISIFLIYTLGKILYNEYVGILSAIFLSLSPYGVMYGPMVRPYPLAMTLSLLSTIRMIKLSRTPTLSFKDKKLFSYIVTVLIGLYTIYHFIFVFLSQIIALLATNLRNKKNILKITTIFIIIALLYLPWIPFLLDQLNVINSGKFYFHGGGYISASSFATQLLLSNYTRILFLESRLVPFVGLVSIAVLVMILVAVIFTLRSPDRRSFVVMVAVYFLSYCISERLTNMHTLTVSKFYFFMIPALFVMVAVGIYKIMPGNFLRNACALLFTAILLSNSVFVSFARPPALDPPLGLRNVRDKIGSILKNGQKGLVIVNTDDRRCLLSLADAINTPVDIKVLSKKLSPDGHLESLKNIGDYQYIFFVTFYNKDIAYPPEKTEYILTHLKMFKNVILVTIANVK